jgi:L,D-peptidoglycan transpeptidase YkuD (ErfK/YbiS/YcfS/YnhG family)
MASVVALSQSAARGVLRLANLSFPCALGRNGCRALKREGDGATPIGRWRVRAVHYRPDRVRRPSARVPTWAIGVQDGWCDALADRNYNRPVRLPYAASAERLWRQDELYDIVVVLDHNARPRVRGRGSAIFMHVARPGYAPTQGCIALARPHLLRVIARLGARAAVAVLAGPKKDARSFRLGRREHVPGKWRARGSGQARWSASLAAR